MRLSSSSKSSLVRSTTSLSPSLSTGPELNDSIAVCVVSSMLLRATADLLVPIQFLMILGLLRYAPSAQYNNWVSQGQLSRTSSYLAFNVLIELLFFVTVCCILHYRGMRPLPLLRGAIAASGVSMYVTCLTTALTWYASLQLVHDGCDFDFNFEWVHGGSVWVTAHQWVSAPL